MNRKTQTPFNFMAWLRYHCSPLCTIKRAEEGRRGQKRQKRAEEGKRGKPFPDKKKELRRSLTVCPQDQT